MIRRGGNNSTPEHIQRREGILRDIFKKKIEGFDDADIIKLLNLNQRTYYFYRDQLYDRIKLANLKKDDAYILGQQDILSGRLNRIYQRLNERFENEVDIMKIDEVNILVQKLQDLAIVIFKLDVEGLRVTKFINNFVDQQSEQLNNKQQKAGGNSEPLPRLVYNQQQKTEQQQQGPNIITKPDIQQQSSSSTTNDNGTNTDTEYDISGNMDDPEEVF